MDEKVIKRRFIYFYLFIYLFITIYGIQKNRSQRMKCKIVKDPKQIASGTKIKNTDANIIIIVTNIKVTGQARPGVLGIRYPGCFLLRYSVLFCQCGYKVFFPLNSWYSV